MLNRRRFITVLLIYVIVTSLLFRWWLRRSITYVCNGSSEISVTQMRLSPTITTTDMPINDVGRYPCLNHAKVSELSGYISCVHIFNESEPKTKKDCLQISYRTLNGPTPMCLYDSKEDVYISKSLRNGGSWEGGFVNGVSQILKKNPDLEYLDVGCNIGAYTVAAAKLGNRVVGVDPLLQNLRLLSQSLHLGNIHRHVTLVWNAISNTTEYVKFQKYKGNVGGTAIKSYHGKDTGDDNYIAEAVVLDDLIPLFKKGTPLFIKLDIETRELSALLGGQQFLDFVDVRYVQMEFHSHIANGEGKVIVDIMSGLGLKPYKDIGKTAALDKEQWTRWNHDVFFFRT